MDSITSLIISKKKIHKLYFDFLLILINCLEYYFIDCFINALSNFKITDFYQDILIFLFTIFQYHSNSKNEVASFN